VAAFHWCRRRTVPVYHCKLDRGQVDRFVIDVDERQISNDADERLVNPRRPKHLVRAPHVNLLRPSDDMRSGQHGAPPYYAAGSVPVPEPGAVTQVGDYLDDPVG
jgi:hypothetical protein